MSSTILCFPVSMHPAKWTVHRSAKTSLTRIVNLHRLAPTLIEASRLMRKYAQHHICRERTSSI